MTVLSLGPDRTPDVSPDAWIAASATVAGDVALGAGSSVWYSAVLRAESAGIRVGEGSNLQDGAVVHVDAGFPAVLGRDVSVGHNAVVHGATVGDGCLVGMNATLLNGVVLGTGCLVAAGAVVPAGTVVPDGSLVAGVPARVRRSLDAGERAELVENALRYRATAALHRAAAGPRGATPS